MDRLRTLLARFTVAHFTRPKEFVVPSYFWLAEDTHDIKEKLRCPKPSSDSTPETNPPPSSFFTST